jgi:hypothetical protein
MIKRGTNVAKFDYNLLAFNRFNGYLRTGKAATMGKAKKLVKVFTVGVPVLFSRYIFNSVLPGGFPRLKLLNPAKRHKRSIRRKKK